jgi:hypothetical protein
MINDHGLSAFKIIPHWFHKLPPAERGSWSGGGADRHPSAATPAMTSPDQCDRTYIRESWHPVPMAGGMTRRDGPTLAERVGATSSRGGDDARHCWVVEASGHPGRWPGLLLEWRHEDHGWMGRVAYALPDLDQPGARLVERWLPADHLIAVANH